MEKAREQATSQEAMIIMEPDPVRRLRTKYRTLQRQVFFIQSVSLLLCFACCLFTFVHHTYPATCTENGTEEAPTFKAQRKVIEEINTSFTRLAVDCGNFTQTDKYVPWKHTSILPPEKTTHFTLNEDGKTLVVHRTGTYKVSLQITYRGQDQHTGEMILQNEVHWQTQRYGKDIVLLTNMETVNFTTPYWKKSLYSGNVFALEAGDKLKVCSNRLPLIDIGMNCEQKNFLALEFSK